MIETTFVSSPVRTANIRTADTVTPARRRTENFWSEESIDPADTDRFSDRFQFSNIELKELDPVTVENRVAAVRVGGDLYRPSPRFMKTLMSLFGFSENIFQYYSPAELLDRITERREDSEIRICIDRDRHLIHGVVRPGVRSLPLRTVCGILAEDKRLAGLNYDPLKGCISARLNLPDQWTLPGDSKYHTFLEVQYPVDQSSTPKITLGTIRLICRNGAVARRKCFETTLVVDKDRGTHLRHLLSTFNNRAGFDALRDRMQIAQNTKASVNEFLQTANAIRRSVKSPESIISRMHTVAGLPEESYGVTRLDSIREHHRRDLPVGASVMDLINIVTELATHHEVDDRDYLHGFVTNLLAKEFDLEELVTNTRSAESFYLKGVEA